MSLRLVVDPAVIQDYPALAVSLGLTDFQPVNGPSTPYGHNIPAAAYNAQGEPIPGAPGYFVVRQCEGAAPTFFDGPLTPAQVAAIPACTTDQNAATLRTKALAGITRRNAFLALANPTNAQTLAEVKAQARDLNAITRLLLSQFDSAADS